MGVPVPISTVLSLCGYGAEANSGRASVNIPCPICDGGTRKKRLNVRLDNHVFRCAKCDSKGGALHLYAFLAKGADPRSLNKSDFSKIIREINGDTKINPVSIPKAPVIKRIDQNVAKIDVRDKAYNVLLEDLFLNKNHYNDLIRRGLRHSDIIAGKYRSTPVVGSDSIAESIRSRGVVLDGVPGFYRKDDFWAMTKQNPGFYIPVRTLDETFATGSGKIQGLQVRYDKANVKYMWLSSRDMEDGAGAETWCHFRGYPEEEVILTEGPLKADIIYRFLDKPVVAIPGVNALKHLEIVLKKLKKYKVKKIFIAFDMDYKTNPHVRRALENIKTEVGKNFQYTVMNWDPDFKGLDDYLLHKYLASGGELDPLKE